MTGGPSGSSLGTGDGDVPSPLGWRRAVVTALVILAVGAGLFIFGPNWILTHLTGLSRNGRVASAATGFVVLLVASAWVLRRLQARRVI